MEQPCRLRVAPAGNGTFVLRCSLGDGLTVVGTIGLADDESAAAIRAVHTASAGEWRTMLRDAPPVQGS